MVRPSIINVPVIRNELALLALSPTFTFARAAISFGLLVKGNFALVWVATLNSTSKNRCGKALRTRTFSDFSDRLWIRNPKCTSFDRTINQAERWSPSAASRSEEHTSELQSLLDLVCRLLL